MADSNIPVGSTSEKLQTWENLIGADEVHTEATTPTDPTGVPYSTTNRFPVDASVSVTMGEVEITNDTGNPVPMSSADVGAQADAAATTDTGTFSLIAFVKRSLQNWTTLLARIPALVTGRVPVDGSGVTQPVSGSVSVSNFPASQPVTGTFFQATQPVSAASLPLPAGAATAALQPNLVGTFNYVSGTLSGAGNKTGTGRCIGIRVFASGADGTFNINGGDTITVRSGTGVDINPGAQVTAPVVNWVSGTLDIVITGLT